MTHLSLSVVRLSPSPEGTRFRRLLHACSVVTVSSLMTFRYSGKLLEHGNRPSRPQFTFMVLRGHRHSWSVSC